MVKTTEKGIAVRKTSTWDKVVLGAQVFFIIFPPLVAQRIANYFKSLIRPHRYISPEPFVHLPKIPGPVDAAPSSLTRNIVIVGASFGGYSLSRELGRSIPSGYRIIVIEKNESIHHVWNFPRCQALPPYPSHTPRAFVPYDLEGFYTRVPPGAIEWIRGRAVTSAPNTNATEDSIVKGYVVVQTTDGGTQVVPFNMLVIATGGDGAKLQSVDTAKACDELIAKATEVSHAKKIIVVGGGAVGVELATDIKSQYGDSKNVTIIHSRERLLNRYGTQLSERALEQAKKLGLRVILGERPELPGEGPGTLVIPSTEEKIEYDLLIKCTGGGSWNATTWLHSLLPEAAFASDSRIIVSPTLQVRGTKFGEVFSCGDVVHVDLPNGRGEDVPLMARAAMHQAEVAAKNITALANAVASKTPKRPVLVDYSIRPFENAIKLSLGLHEACTWLALGKRELSWMHKLKSLDLDSQHAYQFWGVRSSWPPLQEEPEDKVVER